MQLSINFNWPLGSARVSLGGQNINDKEYEFRIGVIPKDKKDSIYWVMPDWFSGEMENEVVFDVSRDDKVMVERRRKGTTDIEMRTSWNIDEEWPAEAYGPACTIVPWIF